MRLKLLFSTLLCTLLLFTSCNKCKDVVCINGECEKGECICDEGYEADDCSVAAAEKFLGDWEVDEDCDGIIADYDVSITKVSAGRIRISNFGDVSGDEIEAKAEGNKFTFNDQISQISVAGTGTLVSGSTINLSYTVSLLGFQVYNCTATMDKL